MISRIFKTESGFALALPEDVLEQLGVQEGSDVDVMLELENHQIVIRLLDSSGIDEEFARQVATFIEKYRQALDVLAKS